MTEDPAVAGAALEAPTTEHLVTDDAAILVQLAGAGYTYAAGTPFAARALHAVDLTVRAGEFLVVAGPSRSGKSTLAQLCNGVLAASPGTVTVDGVALTAEDSAKRHARRAVGLVLQYPEAQLFAETVGEDIAFGPRNFGVEPDVDGALTAVGMDPATYRDRGIDMLSGGQKRRVAIAGVLACQPKLIVLDEPVSGIDPDSTTALLDTLRALTGRGIGVLVLCAAVAEVADRADRMVVLEDGTVAATGKPADVLADTELVTRTGIGTPQVWAALDTVARRGLDVQPGLVTPAAAAARIAAARR